MNRFATSWRLMTQSYRVLMQDKELMLLPILSGLTLFVVCALFLIPLGVVAVVTGADRDMHHVEIGANLPTLALFGLYVASYTVGIFFHCALVAGASQRLAGGDPTIGSSLAAAWRRFPAILAWGVVAATVGMILRAIQERSGWVGKIVVVFVGAAWGFATFFVVPVLVMEERSIGDTFKRSLELVKERWGESLIGGVGLGLAAFFGFWLPLVVAVVALALAGLFLSALVVGAVGCLCGIAFFSALQSVYLASLYRYATVGDAPAGFASEDFAAAFRRKK